MGIPYNIDASIVRGLDYYTRTVFEFVSTQIGAQGTVCGGGRYDGLLAELGGNPGPGMGFAMGIERIILVLRAMGIVREENNAPRIFIASIGQTEAALALCQKLRESDVYAVCDVAGRSLKAQMKNADREGAAFSLVLGEDEVKQGEAQLKNMETGEKVTVSLSDIPALIALI